MTFRPSDDVLDEINNGKQPAQSNQYYTNYDNPWNSSNWWGLFHKTDENDWQVIVSDEVLSAMMNISTEEVKAPDLTELLKWNQKINSSEVWWEANSMSAWKEDSSSIPVVETGNKTEIDDKWLNIWNTGFSAIELEVPGNISDEERFKMVSWIDGASHSNLDFLVDNQWWETVDKYKKIHRFVFRWWIFIVITIIGLVWWIFFDVKAYKTNNIEIINESSILNKDDWNKGGDISVINDIWEDVSLIVPYGTVSVAWKLFNSRSNLILYKWIVLPQLVSLNYEIDDFVYWGDFNDWNVSRSDLEALIEYLVTNNSIYRKTSNLSSPIDIRRKWQVLNGWLIDWFNLSCIDTHKVSDFICDKFLWNFYEYGKYYDLSRYSSELLKLVKALKKEHKDIEPICEMINEYTLHSWVVSSDDLYSVMEYCEFEDLEYYKKIINFIEVDNSLWQPELSDKVFDNRDINAYKLISSWQNIYKILEGTSINENYINSYLTFVQNLINRDKQSGDYLAPIYKDLLYVFNTDILYKKLLDSWSLSNVIKWKLDVINNGNVYLDYIWLVWQLKTDGIVKGNWEFWWSNAKDKTIEEIFAQFYSMTDYLKIRKVNKISDREINTQIEIFTDKILWKTGWETLKAVVDLSRVDNILYVDDIKIPNQPDFSEILEAYVWNQQVTLPAIIVYIDEQVWTWYKIQWEEDEKWNFCEDLVWGEEMELYTCDDSSIILYKWDIEYTFQLVDGIMESFKVSDNNLDTEIHDKLKDVMLTRNNTPTIIQSIIDFSIQEGPDNNLDQKLRIINQFRINLKLEPNNIMDIEWESDVFLVDFTLWDIDLQARYNVETHLMTRISYVACDKVLEIRNLWIDVSVNNEEQLTEILNNPRMFFTQVNQAAYRKYQRLCDEPW